MRYYAEALRYASRLNPYPPIDHRDLVHTAYLNYFKAHGTNLFDQHPGTVFRTIKYTFFDSIKHKSWTKDKQAQGVRQFQPINELDAVTTITPHDIAVGNELKGKSEELLATTSGFTHKVLALKLRNFTNAEIADELEVTRGLITYYLKKVNLSILNPSMIFSASSLKNRKKITRETFNRNPLYAQEYIYDVDMGADYNEYYTLLAHRTETGEGLLIVEKYDANRRAPN